MDPSSLSLLVSALGGGLAGAIVTILSNLALTRWRRPILEIRFDDSVRGCAASTPAILQPAGTRGTQRTLRLRVRNVGKTTAHAVNVCATEIAHTEIATGRTILFSEEVIDLVMALSDRTVFDLAPGAFRFVDVFYSESFGERTSFRFAFPVQPIRLGLLGMGIGDYSMVVVTTGSSLSSSQHRIDWTWDGSVEGAAITGCRRIPSAA
jgi:hypothetical protein